MCRFALVVFACAHLGWGWGVGGRGGRGAPCHNLLIMCACTYMCVCVFVCAHRAGEQAVFLAETIGQLVSNGITGAIQWDLTNGCSQNTGGHPVVPDLGVPADSGVGILFATGAWGGGGVGGWVFVVACSTNGARMV